ncbi:PucR family transcriptional regulator ligand-binding domain-containing protein [Gordonia sp. NPDC003376]
MSDLSDTTGGLTLRDALDDPALAAARPTVLAGWNALGTPLRWVHTSEVLDVADLLSGGELVLVAGVLLGDADEAAMRAYLDSLADVGAAGLAVEGPRLGGVPQPLVHQAAARGFPLIELGEVVRFVDVTHAINSRLVAAQVRELQANDQVTHALAGILAAQGDIASMVEALSELTGCSVTVRSMAGAVIAETAVADARPRGYARVAPIDSAGVTVATLELTPRPGVDLHLIEAACRRAPEPLALALLRGQPLTRSDQHVREIFRLLAVGADRDNRRRPEDVLAAQVATAGLGLDGPGLFAGVVAISVSGTLHTVELSEALRRNGNNVLSEIRDGAHRSIVRIPIRGSTPTGADVVDLLTSSALPGDLRIGVTEPAPDILSLAPSMATARTAAASASARVYVVRARDVVVAHLLDDLDAAAVGEFCTEVLGPLLDSDRADELLLTLVMLHRCGSRVAAAQTLNIHRQTMYQRLDRIGVILGGLPDEATGARGALIVAAELELVRRGIAP